MSAEHMQRRCTVRLMPHRLECWHEMVPSQVLRTMPRSCDRYCVGTISESLRRTSSSPGLSARRWPYLAARRTPRTPPRSGASPTACERGRRQCACRWASSRAASSAAAGRSPRTACTDRRNTAVTYRWYSGRPTQISLCSPGMCQVCSNSLAPCSYSRGDKKLEDASARVLKDCRNCLEAACRWWTVVIARCSVKRSVHATRCEAGAKCALLHLLDLAHDR